MDDNKIDPNQEVQISTVEEAKARLRKKIPNFDEIYKANNVTHLPQSIDYKNPIKLEELLNKNIPTQTYILHPILPTQGIGFIYAATGLGKTLFALNIAYAIAKGGKFLSYTADLSRRVMYVDGEMPENQMQDRAMRIKKVQGELKFNENFLLVNCEVVKPLAIPVIDTAEGQAVYLSWIEKFSIEVIIFDNLSMLSGIDENKSHEWKIVQDFLIKLRAMGKTVLIIHHAGKEKKGFRGTSRMLDAADVAISLQAVDDDKLENESIKCKTFKIIYHKARHFSGVDALPIEITLANDQWSFKSTEENDLLRVVERKLGGLSVRDIVEDLGIKKWKVEQLLSKAKILGMLRGVSGNN